jgi:hypothetical protein
LSYRIHPFFEQEFDALVFYALPSTEADPAPGTPSLVLLISKADAERLFLPDRAPNLSVLEARQLDEELATIEAEKCRSPLDLSAVERVRAWFRPLGASACGYQLEPAALAGDGTAVSRGREAERG